MMRSKEIVVIRHGETDFNRAKIVQGSGVDGDLNDTGLNQADQFYRYFKRYQLDLIFCSTLKRTFQTIQNFTNDAPLIRLSDLDEISWGDQEGKHSTPETIRAYKAVVNQWSAGQLDAHLPNGESAKSIFERMARVRKLLCIMDFDRILICTHGRAMRALMCVLFDQPAHYMEQYTHSNTGVYKIRLSEDKFELLLKNDDAHLE